MRSPHPPATRPHTRELTERPAHVRDVVVAGEEPAKEKKKRPSQRRPRLPPKEETEILRAGKTSLARLGHEVQKDELARKAKQTAANRPIPVPIERSDGDDNDDAADPAILDLDKP